MFRNPIARAALTLGAVCTILGSTARAQEAIENDFLFDAAKRLRSFATFCLKAGYPLRAKDVYREVLAEYDENDEVVRKALGYMKVGTAWQKKSGFSFPDQETPDAAIATRIAKRWAGVAKALGEGHRKVGEELVEAGEQFRKRADWHFERALRFLPNDSASAKSRGMKNFEGFFGTEVDVQILQRSRLMDRELQTQREKSYSVQSSDRKHKVLDAAGVSYHAVASEHFTVYGDVGEELMMEAALQAERGLAFCQAAFGETKGFSAKGAAKHHAYFKNRDTWAKVIRNSIKDARRRDFVLQYASGAKLSGAEGGIHVVNAGSKELINDYIVRNVTQGFSGFRSAALQEGIGHAVVGMMFGRNLVYILGLEEKKRQTVVAGAEEKPKVLLPDLSAWEMEAKERAWSTDGTPVAKLPLVSAAQFPVDGRIKSWSFCDYMIRRDPSLLTRLDRAAAGARTQRDVADRFRKATDEKEDVQELENAWARFWREDTPLLRTIRSKTTPLEATSKAAAEWLREFNAFRKRQQLEAVGWSADFSSECKQHVGYLKANKGARGPGKEDTQDAKKKQGSSRGRAFAQMAITSTKGKDPKKVIAKWLCWPGYRDAIVNPKLDTIGIYVDRQIAVLDLTRGQVGSSSPVVFAFPNNRERRERAVPNEVTVKELGPEVAAALQKAGKKRLKKLGFPITFHFGRAGPKDPEAVRCVLKRNDKDVVEGMMHFGSSGEVRRTSAPGLYTFYPFEPLKKGSLYTAEWTWPGKSNKVTFETR